MQREKSVNVKEVIASLCRILSGLSVESIPTADAFRRAKFNKQDAAMDMWILLNGLLLKAFALDCACQNAKDQQFDTQLLFVRSALWHCGYGAPWVVAPRPPSHLEEVGSRELLLAFGWVLSSGKLLEFLLAEKVHDLDTLSSAPRVPQGLILGQEDIVAHGAEADSKETVRNDQALRALQWQYGKLRLQWKSLLSAQEERSRLIHRVLSKINPSAICQNNVTGSHQSDMTSTALDKELERIQALNEILESYLDWKLHEPLFWCWMDSVIDSSLADTSEMKQADCPLGGQAVTLRCPHGDKARRAVRRLDKMLLRLQTELRVRRIEQSTLTLTSQGRHQEAAPLSDRQKMEVDEKVAGYLEGLHLTNTSTITSRGFLPCLQDPHPVKPSHRFHTGDSGLPVTAGKVQASWALGELKEREATLQLRLERLRQNIRVEMQRQASTIDGVVLIPPINK
ncbi:tubulin epsilon and delta complex protein 1-like isoform X1 [Myxocyprinus asiaticus]|uniref:tubulin epsilon and delta complex protein 1-like isoform X1 n=1 Tax=Myxocyprinus asiaticus TaxID=70543 RepID=UPI0022216EF7|nr:tubulin epsilon and delta complex protein 1-like isoform X1 [Myxocyprinus asiaticus]